MKALCWHGKEDVRLDSVPDPTIKDPGDAIIKITSTAICGSDLHLYGGLIPTMEEGDILGHEFMGEVVEVGSDVRNLKAGDRVVVPFTIGCGHCAFCESDLWALCDNSNPNTEMAKESFGHATSALFGYSHMFGGIPGGQAEYARVPYADVGPVKVPNGMADEKALFLSDIFPTGYMAAENCDIERGDTIAVWGCGPVGLFAIQSAYLLGAERVIAIDSELERLELAAKQCRAETIDSKDGDVVEKLQQMTKGRGPDGCIDSVGMEAHGMGGKREPARVLTEAIMACRKAGVLSIPGVYGSPLDEFPLPAAHTKGLAFRMGQTHVQRYLQPLLRHIQEGDIDPSFLITHRMKLADGPDGYSTFQKKEDGCVKIVMTP